MSISTEDLECPCYTCDLKAKCEKRETECLGFRIWTKFGSYNPSDLKIKLKKFE